MAPEVYISILNWNGKELTRQCLTSLFDVTSYENFEVIVVDNGSTDGSVPMLEEEFPEVTLIANESNRGFAKGNNQAFEVAMENGADYVLMLNNDTELVDPEWLSKLVEVAERERDIGIVGCRVVEPDGTLHYDGRYFPMFVSCISQKYEYNRYQEKNGSSDYEYIDEVVGAVFLVKRALIEKIGILDETYSPAYGEESDYCVRAWDAGFKVAYTDEVEVEHLRHQTADQMDPCALGSIRLRNKLRFVLMNYPLPWIVMSIPYFARETKDLLFGDASGSDGRRQLSQSIPWMLRAYGALVRDSPDILAKHLRRRNARDLVK